MSSSFTRHRNLPWAWDEAIESLRPIYDALGPLKAFALPGPHSLSGFNTTGSFANKGKMTWWGAFESTTDDVLESLPNFGTTPNVSHEMMTTLKKFV